MNLANKLIETIKSDLSQLIENQKEIPPKLLKKELQQIKQRVDSLEKLDMFEENEIETLRKLILDL